jgi:serine phosphatase RsbU (regulator of sigma subunit)
VDSGRDKKGARPRPLLYLPTWSQLRIAAQQRMLAGTGGDFFEIVQGRDGRVSMVMADVSGNGPSAALPVSSLRWVIRQEMTRGEAPGAILGRLNDWVVAQTTPERFVTALCVRIDPQVGLVEIASAGHLGPFVKRASGGATDLPLPTGLGLGILPGERYEALSIELQPEDLVVLVTDGISDRFAAKGDPLGTAGVIRQLSGVRHTSESVCATLLGSPHSSKDETVIVIELPRRHRRVTPIAQAG